MRFMLIRKADAETEAGIIPSEQFMRDMLAYNQEMAAAGVLVEGVGLQSSSKGARVKFSAGKPVSVTDGPFTEAKELIAGYTMIQVASKQEAIEWVKRWPAIDSEVEIEVRQVFEPEDLGTRYVEQSRQQDEAIRIQQERQQQQ